MARAQHTSFPEIALSKRLVSETFDRWANPLLGVTIDEIAYDFKARHGRVEFDTHPAFRRYRHLGLKAERDEKIRRKPVGRHGWTELDGRIKTSAIAMRATMADVARETGLTPGTVSRALNTEGKYAISPETRERVLAVATRMGYRPNLIGRALAAGSASLVLLISPAPFSPYYVEISRHLSALATDHGYSFVTGGALPKSGVAGIAANDWLYGVDGIVVCDCLPHQEAYVAEALRLKIPIVGLGVRDPFPTDFIKVDLYPAARALMTHLIEQGCERPAMTLSPGSEPSDPRRRAYQEAVAAQGAEERFLWARDQSRDSARRAAIDGYRAEEFDALFCENDLMAVGALRGLLDEGIRVPEDVLLAGCDGLEDAAYQATPITTIEQPLDRMCAMAWTMLQARIEGGDVPPHTLEVVGRLVTRSSTLRDKKHLDFQIS